jgi:hypothetical protein
VPGAARPSPVHAPAPRARRRRCAEIRWRGACPPGRAVELHLLRDAAHAWPADATERILAFLRSASR